MTTTPFGCRHCGVEKYSHFLRWAQGVRLHRWAAPTKEQVLARMRARRAERTGG